MEENKEASAKEKSSEQPELQQDSLKTEEVGKDQQHLEHQTSAHHQQSVESHSPSKISSSESENPVLRSLLTSSDQEAAQQAYLASDRSPCSSKQAQPSSSLQSMQGEKRRSDELLIQHLQSKQIRQPDDVKEKKETKEKEEKTKKSDA